MSIFLPDDDLSDYNKQRLFSARAQEQQKQLLALYDRILAAQTEAAIAAAWHDIDKHWQSCREQNDAQQGAQADSPASGGPAA